MAKNVSVYALLMFVSCTLCEGQIKTEITNDVFKSETKGVITSSAPNSIVRTIKQDRNGNIWIAAFDGVFKYDGKSFANITTQVSSARFFSVLEDRKGNMWFGTIGSGVYRYDPVGGSFQNFTTNEGLVNNEIVCIYEDKTGDIWFGANGGASRYNGKTFRNYMMNGDSMMESVMGKTFPNLQRPPNEVNSIIEDKTGNYGLVPEAIPIFMMEKHLPFSPITANHLRMFVR